MSGNVEALGTKIRRLRMDRGISQDRLAIEAMVDQSGLSKFERGLGGKHKFGRIPLERISRVLRITYEELVANTDFGA